MTGDEMDRLMRRRAEAAGAELQITVADIETTTYRLTRSGCEVEHVVELLALLDLTEAIADSLAGQMLAHLSYQEREALQETR